MERSTTKMALSCVAGKPSQLSMREEEEQGKRGMKAYLEHADDDELQHADELDRVEDAEQLGPDERRGG